MSRDSAFIYELLSLGYEGHYWDFKREWHKNKAELLHDILCLANNPDYEDGLLIIGIDDESLEIIGVNNDDENRKTTQQLNDFLRSKSFVGDIRPMVCVKRLAMEEGKKIDVIIIENSKNTPYILSKDYPYGGKSSEPVEMKVVRMGNIYTRVQDSNTPIDSTADNDKAEALWRKRFRINDSPMSKLKFYLKDVDGWEKSGQGMKYSYYYKYAPEYSIDLEPYGDEDSSQTDYLCKMCIANIGRPACYRVAHFKVFDQVIWEWHYVFLDDGRFNTVVPYFQTINIGQDCERKFLSMNYMLASNDLVWLFYKFICKWEMGFYGETSYQWDNWLKCVILFRDKKEKDLFIQHVKDCSERLWKTVSNIGSLREVSEERNQWTELDDKDWRSAITLKKEYEQWATNNKDIPRTNSQNLI